MAVQRKPYETEDDQTEDDQTDKDGEEEMIDEFETSSDEEDTCVEETAQETESLATLDNEALFLVGRKSRFGRAIKINRFVL